MKTVKSRKSKVALVGSVIAVAVAVASVSAWAVTTYDAATGGFAGKGDIQTQWGWSDSDMQNNWTGTAITYKKNEKVSSSCEWTVPDEYYTSGKNAGQLKKASYSVANTKQSVSNVKGDIAYDGKTSGRNAKMTGFILKPVSNVETVGSLPELGDYCEGRTNGTTYAGTVVCVGSVTDSDGDGQVSDEPCIDDREVMEVVTADYTGTTMTKTCTGSGRKQTCTTTQVPVTLPTITLWKDGVSTIQPPTTTTAP